MSEQPAPRILLVDDDRASRETLSEWVERQGWEPIAVKDGDEALEEIADRRQMSLPALIREIDETRGEAALSSAIRVYLLNRYRSGGSR